MERIRLAYPVGVVPVRNVSTLHRAGADFVMSYSSIGANAIFNFLKNEDTSMLAEGLNIFRLKAPKSLVGKNLARSGIREATECSVVAIRDETVLSINPDPQILIREGTELILIGTNEGERNFVQAFQGHPSGHGCFKGASLRF